MESYKKRLLETLKINGVESEYLNYPFSKCNCTHCKKEINKDNIYITALFPRSFGKDSISSNTEYPLVFDKASVIFMCRTCIDEMFSREDILIIPINHNGDFKDDYYLLWSLDAAYSKKKIEEMYSLTLNTIVIDYVPYDLYESILYKSRYNELKTHPYLLEATFSERGLYRKIRELNAWNDILHKKNRKIKDNLNTVIGGIIILIIYLIIGII